jgi:hypothetical protein
MVVCNSKIQTPACRKIFISCLLADTLKSSCQIGSPSTTAADFHCPGFQAQHISEKWFRGRFTIRIRPAPVAKDATKQKTLERTLNVFTVVRRHFFADCRETVQVSWWPETRNRAKWWLNKRMRLFLALKAPFWGIRRWLRNIP